MNSFTHIALPVVLMVVAFKLIIESDKARECVLLEGILLSTCIYLGFVKDKLITSLFLFVVLSVVIISLFMLRAKVITLAYAINHLFISVFALIIYIILINSLKDKEPFMPAAIITVLGLSSHFLNVFTDIGKPTVNDKSKIPMIVNIALFFMANSIMSVLIYETVYTLSSTYCNKNVLLNIIGMILSIMYSLLGIYTGAYNNSFVKGLIYKEKVNIENNIKNITDYFNYINTLLQKCVASNHATKTEALLIQEYVHQYEALYESVDIDNGTIYIEQKLKMDELCHNLERLSNIFTERTKSEQRYGQSTKGQNTNNTQNDIDKAMSLFMLDSLQGVTLDELKKIRNRLLKSFHPDNANDNSMYAQKINRAYDLLSNVANK